MKIEKIYTPNFSKKRRSHKSIKFIIIHYTGMQSERESLNRLCNSGSKVSSHFVINQKGKIYRLVKDNQIAWHAGKSCWGKYKDLNTVSIGIELVNKGHKFGYTNFKKQQLSSLVKICKNLIKKYNIKKQNVIGHSDIAPSRKIDPGEKFPWQELADTKIGIWHNCKTNILKKFRKVKFSSKLKLELLSSLKKIGYCFDNKRRVNFSKTIQAFQRHYRKELINGIMDKECLIIAKNISKKI